MKHVIDLVHSIHKEGSLSMISNSDFNSSQVLLTTCSNLSLTLTLLATALPLALPLSLADSIAVSETEADIESEAAPAAKSEGCQPNHFGLGLRLGLG